jgi:hypothetical protein
VSLKLVFIYIIIVDYLDITRLSYEAFIGSIAYNRWCLSKVGLVCNDFDTTSFGYGYDGSPAA